MTSFEHPLCKRPIAGIFVNLVVAILFVFLAFAFGKLAYLFWGMSLVFVAASMVFLMLALLQPSTKIEISPDSITKYSILGHRTIALDDIASAIVAADPEASHRLRLDITSRSGVWMGIDSRFIPSPQCEFLSVLSSALQARGRSIQISCQT